MEKMLQFNTDVDKIMLSKVPQIADIISKSGHSNQENVEEIVNRLLDKMTDLTLKKFAKYGMGQEVPQVALTSGAMIN